MTLKEIVPEDSGFTATNGIRIDSYVGLDAKQYMVGRFGENPITGTTFTHVTASAEGIEALREFFRHEEDERLSRWRSNVDTDIVGYAVDDASIRLVDEATHGNTSMFYRTDTDGLGPLSKAAREYFDAHPEPKPWDDGRFGEVWILTDEAGVQMPATFQAPGSWMFHGSMSSRFRDGLSITAGRKIWPEDAS